MQSPRVRFFVDLRCKFNGMECAIRAVSVLQNYLLYTPTLHLKNLGNTYSGGISEILGNLCVGQHINQIFEMRIINLSFKAKNGKNVFLSSQFVELIDANVDRKFI